MHCHLFFLRDDSITVVDCSQNVDQRVAVSKNQFERWPEYSNGRGADYGQCDWRVRHCLARRNIGKRCAGLRRRELNVGGLTVASGIGRASSGG